MPNIGMAEPAQLFDGLDGATCYFFNAGAQLPWRNRGGDWIDAKGAIQGSTPFASVYIKDLDRVQRIELDLARMVESALRQGLTRLPILLRAVPGKPRGSIPVFAREAKNPAVRPTLTLELAGKAYVLHPVADAELNCSTHKGLGTRDYFNIGGTSAVLEFALPHSSSPGGLSGATLRLTTKDKQYGEAELGVFWARPPDTGMERQVLSGLAARYVEDKGLERNPAVILVARFEDTLWKNDWTVAGGGEYIPIARDDARKFVPLDGRALRVNLARGKQLGLDLRFQFADEIGHEPEEIFFRYYLRFADDWSPAVSGGKLPGISGTYNRAGWGGRKSDGTNGWSARGEFWKSPTKENPAHGLTSIGTYAYHADQGDFWGDAWPWTQTQLGLLKRNRWYCIEQYVRLNTPGKRDGVFRAWIDGRLAFERSDVRFRDIDSLKIEMIWMNVYHGGSAPSPHDQHLYIDNVVIAREYIGPARSLPKAEVGR